MNELSEIPMNKFQIYMNNMNSSYDHNISIDKCFSVGKNQHLICVRNEILVQPRWRERFRSHFGYINNSRNLLETCI